MYLIISVCNTKTLPFFSTCSITTKTSKAKLKTYTGDLEVLTILDETNVSVNYKGPSFGRHALSHMHYSVRWRMNFSRLESADIIKPVKFSS